MQEFFSNKMLFVAVLAWFVAQFIKVMMNLVATKHLNLHIIFESGGMPSSHTAIMCAICVGVGRTQGFHSALFALAAVVTMVVMYDATGVRRAAGEQGKVLNKLIDMMKVSEQIQTTLKEVVGHKPLEVLAGALLGIFTGIIFFH